MVDRNYLILLAFTSNITFIASLLTPETPPARRPQKLARRYEARLARQNILAGQRLHSRQRLRLYLDCCHKYSSRQQSGGVCPLFRNNCQNHCI